MPEMTADKLREIRKIVHEAVRRPYDSVPTPGSIASITDSVLRDLSPYLRTEPDTLGADAPCSACNGTGEIFEASERQTCERCRGSKREPIIDTLDDLRAKSLTRAEKWNKGSMTSLEFRAIELAGECGEACNDVKKLVRFKAGALGGADTTDHLKTELADVVICADLLAVAAGINLREAVISKFNATSEKHGFPERIGILALDTKPKHTTK